MQYRDEGKHGDIVLRKGGQIHEFYVDCNDSCKKVVATSLKDNLFGLPVFEFPIQENLLLDIDMECAALEDVLHGEEGNKITHIRKLLASIKGMYSEEDIRKAFIAGEKYGEQVMVKGGVDDYIKSLNKKPTSIMIGFKGTIIQQNQCINKCASYPSECLCEMTKEIHPIVDENNNLVNYTFNYE